MSSVNFTEPSASSIQLSSGIPPNVLIKFREFFDLVEVKERDIENFCRRNKTFILQSFIEEDMSLYWNSMFEKAAEVLNVEVARQNKQPKWKKLQLDRIIYLQELVKSNAENSNISITASPTATISSDHTLQQQHKEQICNAYNLMNEEEKWLLPSGKKLEDTLKHVCDEKLYEDLCHSWVVDLDDCAFARYLNQEDIDAIIATKAKQLPAVDSTLAASIETLLNWHNANNSSSSGYFPNMLQFVIQQLAHVDQDSASFPFFVGAINIINNIISSQFVDNMSETELMLKLWANIVDIQVGAMNLKCRRGEIPSNASAERRHLFAVEGSRKPMGKRADLIIQANNVEIGYGEASLSSDNNSRKSTFDSKMETCKTLKDMLDSTFKRVSGDRDVLAGVVYVGFQFSKTTLSTFFLDYVQGYTCRLRKTKPVVVEFDNIIPSFIQAYKKAHVALRVCQETATIIKTATTTTTNEEFVIPSGLLSFTLPSGLQTPPRIANKRKRDEWLCFFFFFPFFFHLVANMYIYIYI
ncbi:hypothetical protein EDC96DRAFT_528893 [Choanephora cucurbitarum]|nr:hypothetical protein EDC96DRAFT_528893 [Choanephora cucurbitarum]